MKGPERCSVCGRFIADADFESGAAKGEWRQYYNYFYEDVGEDAWAYHVDCEDSSK